MRRRAPPRKVLLALSLTLLLPSHPHAAQTSTGHVEVRVTDHRAGIGDFSTLRIELAAVSLHRRGEPRGKGWVELFRTAPALDIVPLKDGRWAMVGVGRVKAGRYSAVRVRFGEIHGELQRQGLATVVPVESTVAVNLTVEPGSRNIVLIDLYVEDQSDHRPDRYLVKIQDIRVGKP